MCAVIECSLLCNDLLRNMDICERRLLQRVDPAGSMQCGMSWPVLGGSGSGTEERLVWFEGSSSNPIGQVKAECDGLCVLICHIEDVVQIHEECVAVPLEAVLDVRVREPSTM